MKVVITIPAYNEERTIGAVINGIKAVMNRTKYKYKIHVVDDGSRDKTTEAARKAGALVFRHPYNCGLAETFRTEIKIALEQKADVIVHTDADGQYPAETIPYLIKEVESGYDLVLGDRFSGGIESMPLIKKIGNRAFSRSVSRIINFNVNDCQTGLRAFTRELAERVRVQSNHTYTQEQIIKAVRQKFKIKEVPTKFLRRPGKSRLIKHPLEYATKAWINILRIQRDYNPLKFFGKVGLVSLTVGFALGLWLALNFMATGAVGHLPSTILSMLLMLTGLQIILFGFMADMNRR